MMQQFAAAPVRDGIGMGTMKRVLHGFLDRRAGRRATSASEPGSVEEGVSYGGGGGADMGPWSNCKWGRVVIS